jgi:hypothetical protein
MSAAQKAKIVADFLFANYGAIWLVEPQNAAALAHLTAHLSHEAQWFGRNLAVEPRYVEGLAMGLQEEGYVVRGAATN